MALKRAATAVVAFVLFTVTGPSAQQAPVFNRYEVLSVFEGYLEALRQQAEASDSTAEARTSAEASENVEADQNEG